MTLRGRVMRSKAGRDKDKFLVVTQGGKNFSHLCDGKERPLERPKRKNNKHLASTNSFLNEEQMTTNRSLRRALRLIAEGTDTDEEAI